MNRGQFISTNKGFTLVEMVVVTVLISIVAAVSMPFLLRSLYGWQMETAAWQLVTEIRMVQQLAINGEDQRRPILFDSNANLYRVHKDTVVIKEKKLPSGITFDSIAFVKNKLAFNLEGVPTASGDIILRNHYGHKYYIRVLPVTGRVKAGKLI